MFVRSVYLYIVKFKVFMHVSMIQSRQLNDLTTGDRDALFSCQDCFLVSKHCAMICKIHFAKT